MIITEVKKGVENELSRINMMHACLVISMMMMVWKEIKE